MARAYSLFSDRAQIQLVRLLYALRDRRQWTVSCSYSYLFIILASSLLLIIRYSHTNYL
jgi:hypothetical protein